MTYMHMSVEQTILAGYGLTNLVPYFILGKRSMGDTKMELSAFRCSSAKPFEGTFGSG